MSASVLHAGDILRHRASGTQIVVRRSAAETGGHSTVVEAVIPPGSGRPPLHVHPRQLVRVEVLAGRAGVQFGRRRAVVGAGARLAFPAGVPHRIWCDGACPLQLVAELTPALAFERFLVAACAGGRADRAQAAEWFDTVRPTFPPAPLQRLARRRPG